jgi:hypothetical protein
MIGAFPTFLSWLALSEELLGLEPTGSFFLNEPVDLSEDNRQCLEKTTKQTKKCSAKENCMFVKTKKMLEKTCLIIDFLGLSFSFQGVSLAPIYIQLHKI